MINFLAFQIYVMLEISIIYFELFKSVDCLERTTNISI